MEVKKFSCRSKKKDKKMQLEEQQSLNFNVSGMAARALGAAILPEAARFLSRHQSARRSAGIDRPTVCG